MFQTNSQHLKLSYNHLQYFEGREVSKLDNFSNFKNVSDDNITRYTSLINLLLKRLHQEMV